MIGRRYKHLKRGTKYDVDGRAKMQISGDTLMNLLPWIGWEEAKLVAEALEAMTFISYQSVDDQSIYFRPEKEFMDGRFKDVTPIDGWVLRKTEPEKACEAGWISYYKNDGSRGWVMDKDDATLYSEQGFAIRDLENAFTMEERRKIQVIETQREPK
jgi:hypothetical protein